MSVHELEWAYRQQVAMTQKAVLVYMTWRCGKNGAYPAVSTIAEDTGMSERAVHYAISELAKLGLIVRDGREHNTIKWRLNLNVEIRSKTDRNVIHIRDRLHVVR